MKIVDYRNGRLSIQDHSIKNSNTGEQTDLDAEDLLAAAFDKYARGNNEDALALAAMSQALAAIETRDKTQSLYDGMSYIKPAPPAESPIEFVEPPAAVQLHEL